jgi:hypothetical protein
VKLLCINQATLWQDSLAEDLSALMWMGGIGKYQEQKGGVYYSPKALQFGMEQYNDNVEINCRSKQHTMYRYCSLAPERYFGILR